MRRQAWPLLALALFLVAVGVFAVARSSWPTRTESAPVESRLLRVRTIQAQAESQYTVEERFLGRIEAARSSRLGFELAGTLRAVRADEGDEVTAGQVLALLDTARLDARRTELKAALAESAAGESLAEATHRRIEKLTATGAASRQELDEALQQRDSARARVGRVRAQLDAVEVDLAKSRLVAPFAGHVAVRHLDEGTTVGAGEPVLTVLETAALRARVGVSPVAAGTLTPGHRSTLRMADGSPVCGGVTRLLPQREAHTRTIDIIFDLERPLFPLRDGDLIELPIARAVTESGYWIPRAALTESSRGLWAAYVAVPTAENAEGGASVLRLDRRQVEVLHVERDRVFVRGALTPGDRIVVSGLQRLVPDQRVLESPSDDLALN